MPTVTEKDFEWPQAKIVEAARTWHMFNGFTGETCYDCKKTANVLAESAGWFCTCGSFNTQSWHNNQRPHEKPDLGPTREVVRAAMLEAFPDLFKTP